jgi:hypothetical protein
MCFVRTVPFRNTCQPRKNSRPPRRVHSVPKLTLNRGALACSLLPKFATSEWTASDATIVTTVLRPAAPDASGHLRLLRSNITHRSVMLLRMLARSCWLTAQSCCSARSHAPVSSPLSHAAPHAHTLPLAHRSGMLLRTLTRSSLLTAQACCSARSHAPVSSLSQAAPHAHLLPSVALLPRAHQLPQALPMCDAIPQAKAQSRHSQVLTAPVCSALSRTAPHAPAPVSAPLSRTGSSSPPLGFLRLLPASGGPGVALARSECAVP